MKLDVLRQHLQEVVNRLGYDLYDVEYVTERKQNILRVLIDNDAGVSIDDCVEVSHALDPVLDELDPIPNEYSLEVASPGAKTSSIQVHVGAGKPRNGGFSQNPEKFMLQYQTID